MAVIAILLLLLLVAGLFAMTVLGVMLANKAIGASYDRDAAAIKAQLAQGSLRFSEDGVRLRKSALGLMSARMVWLYADLRIDANTLYVMQYHETLFRMGQPIIRVVGRAHTDFVAGMRATMTEHPRLEGNAVIVPCTLPLGVMSLRFQPKNPDALLVALHAIYS